MSSLLGHGAARHVEADPRDAPLALDAHALDARVRESYAKLAKIGEGTYAAVFLGRHEGTGDAVAIKKIKTVSGRDGLDVTALREIKFLRDLVHPNIVLLRDVFSSPAAGSTPAVNMVLEYLGASLEDLIRDTGLTITPPDTKAWLGMTLRGVAYLHARGVLHRDLKPNNLLLNADGLLKIADFGLARDMPAPAPAPHARPMSEEVITLWYRPPELLLGAGWYSDRVDVWSVGCIFAELLLRKPYLPGMNETHQFELICRARGVPRETAWPGLSTLRRWKERSQAVVQALGPAATNAQAPPPPLAGTFLAAREEDLALLAVLLAVNPAERISAQAALSHAYFSAWPAPTHPSRLPGRPSAPHLGGAGGGKTKASTPRVAQLKRSSHAPASPRAAGAGGKRSAARGGRLLDKDLAERKRIARKLAFGN